MKELYFETIDSTSNYLKRNRQDLDSFTAVSASFQSSGRGRNDRVWTAKKGENLLFSVLLKDKPQLGQGPFLSLIAAISVARSLESLGVKEVAIKWPNDVYIAGKKVCGILLEGNVEEYIVIGIGINVNQTEFLDEYRIPPTSIRLALGKEVDIEEFKRVLYANLEEDLRNCEDRAAFISYFSSHDYLKGKKVIYLDEVYTVIGVEDDFSLILEKEGERKTVTSNEVTVILA